VGGCEEGAREERRQTYYPEEAQDERGGSKEDRRGHAQALGGFSEGWREEGECGEGWYCCLVK
jgi:hypothetical protein